MNKVNCLIILALLLCNITNAAAAECLIIKNRDSTLLQNGECTERYSPGSTSKVAISLMGYNEKIILDELHPEFPFQSKYNVSLNTWLGGYNPINWMKNEDSVYSFFVIQETGMSKFQRYLSKFDYGNWNKIIRNDNGSSLDLLQISPIEQVIFLEKILNYRLPVSRKAHIMTRNIMYIQDLIDGWKLFGKDSIRRLNTEDFQNINQQTGWFIGWIEKGSSFITFAYYNQQSDIQLEDQIKKIVIEKLQQLIEYDLALGLD